MPRKYDVEIGRVTLKWFELKDIMAEIGYRENNRLDKPPCYDKSVPGYISLIKDAKWI